MSKRETPQETDRQTTDSQSSDDEKFTDANPAPLSEAEDEIHPYHDGAPPGWQLGERTLQARYRAPKHWSSDFYEMRQQFNIPAFDPDAFLEKSQGCVVYPDIIRHRRNPDITPTTKGVDCLIRGKKNSGKTTFLKRLTIRLGENNDERIIYRGRTDDSGWQELRWWTTLWLPENAAVDATWIYEESEDHSRETIDDLEDVVRDVRYYDDVFDLVDKLGDAPTPSLNVVYPDPSFSGCEQAMRQTPKTGQVLPYTPEWETGPGESPTPLPQWWIAFILTQLEHGHFDAFTSWLADEAHQIFGPPNPSADDHATDKKFDLAGQLLNEARKRMFSWYLATQQEGKIDYRILNEVTSRIHLADGRPNPNTGNKSTIPQGWETVPMNSDFMSGKKTGRGLCYVEAESSGFAEFTWDDFDAHPEDENRWLEITLGEPEQQVRAATEDDVDEDPVSLEFDETFFELHEQTNRLYVRAPGEGKIDLGDPAIVDDLVAPPAEHYEQLGELEFRNELRRSDDGDYWLVTGEVRFDGLDGSGETSETTFVRIPFDGHQVGEEAEVAP